MSQTLKMTDQKLAELLAEIIESQMTIPAKVAVIKSVFKATEIITIEGRKCE